MEIDIITKKDLEEFGEKLLKDIALLLESSAESRNHKKFLKTKDVLDLLGISETKLYELRRKRIIPFKKVDGMIVYPHDPLMKYLNQTGEDG